MLPSVAQFLRSNLGLEDPGVSEPQTGYLPPTPEPPQYDSRQYDEGPREAAPSGWSAPVDEATPYGLALSEAGPEMPTSYNDPTSGGTISQPLPPQQQPEPAYTLVDGRTAPPTQTGTWEPVRTIPNPQRPPAMDPGQWLADDSQSQPPEPFSPYGAPRSGVADINPSAAPDYGDGGAMRQEANRRGVDDYQRVRSTPGEPDYVPPRSRPLEVADVPRIASQAVQAGREAAEAQITPIANPRTPGLISSVTGLNPVAVNILSRVLGPQIPGIGTQEIGAVLSAVVDKFGDSVGRRVAQALGVPDDEVMRIASRRIGGYATPEITITNEDVAGLIGSAVLDPTNFVGAGEAKPVARAAGRVATELASEAPAMAREVGQGAKKVGYALAEEGARQLMDMTPMPRVVPPGVADTLDFPLRVPDDPRAIQAIEASGGRVDPARGVDVYEVRAQDPEAAGKPALRGGVHYEVVPPNGRSSYVSTEGTAEGGSQTFQPAPSRFRSPLITDTSTGGDHIEVAFRDLGMPDPARVETELTQSFGEAQRGNFTPLMDTVDKYGGDSSLVGDIVRTYGNEGTSQWITPLMENIISGNARRQGYDGIITITGNPPRVTQAFDVREATNPTVGRVSKKDKDAAHDLWVAARREQLIADDEYFQAQRPRVNPDPAVRAAKTEAARERLAAARQQEDAAYSAWRNVVPRVKGYQLRPDIGQRPPDEGVTAAGLGVAPESRRFYHGTASAFGMPDGSKFDPDGLYGPGYYLTDDPRVASSYAEARGPAAAQIKNTRERIAKLERESRMEAMEPWWDDIDSMLAKERTELARLENLTQGQNVRAVDVPSDIRLLDAEVPTPPEDVDRVVSTLRNYYGDDVARRFQSSVTLDDNGLPTTPTGQRIFDNLRIVLGEPVRIGNRLHTPDRKVVATTVNQLLSEAGFDGISHVGGQNAPLRDADGNPIMHGVNVIFGESLPRIRNAFSGEVGGSGFIPTMSDARNAAQGGVIGAASEMTSDEELTPQERLARIGAGAALGVAAGRAGRRGGTRVPGQRLGSGMVPEGGGSSFEDFIRKADSPEQQAAREAASQPPARANNDRAIREQFGRPWEEVAPALPSSGDQLGEATRQIVTEGQGFQGRAGRNRVFPDEQAQISGPVQLEPQSLNMNATPGVSASAGLVNDLGNSVGGGVAGATAGYAMPADSEEQRRQNALTGAGIGMVGGPIAGRLLPRTGGAMVAPGVGPVPGGRRFASADDALKAAQSAIQTPTPQPPSAGLNRMEALRRWVVRQTTDNRVDLAELQKEAQRLLGRPLEADEMLLELSRVNPSGAGKVMIDEAIKPVVQSLDTPERQSLTTLMSLLNNVDVAAALGTPNRVFSGGLTAADSQAAAEALWRGLSPAQQAAVGKAGDDLQRVVQHYRDAMVNAGLWTPDMAATMARDYPNWLPTKIVEYMADPASASSSIKGISLRDRGLRAYTLQGTEKAREDPIASLIRYVQDSETAIQKNEVFNAFANLRDRVPGWDKIIKEVPSSTPAARGTGERTVTGFVNGERKTFLVPAPMAASIMMEQGTQVPVLRQLTQFFREFITRTPLFVAGQVPLDAFAYTVRQAAREGGPQALPGVAADLARGYAEAFRGLLSGEFKGDAARYLREGGAMAGYYERAANAASQTLDDLTRRNMFEVRNVRDARKLAGWLLGGGWVQAAGERVEMAPRIAAFRQGERRAIKAGAAMNKAALEGVMEGRDVTLDFQRGGVAAKIMNQIVPFFNVGVQSAATLPRAFRQNPTAFTTTALSLVAAPTMLAEAWNRMDDQRSRDYDDVPQYVKDRGIVFMLPGVTGRDERGDRRPNYAMLPMRELSPIAILARDLMQGVMGNSSRTAGETARAILGAASPIQANGVADLASSFLPPVASTPLQLATDRDFFRGGPIATDRADESASSLATGATKAWNAVTGRQDRPSQTEFAIRDLFGGVGQIAASTSNAITGKSKDEDRIQSTPVVGGIINRFMGDAVGNRLTRAQEEDTRVPASVRKVLEDAGVPNADLKPVASKWQGVNLTRVEQERWQTRTNRLMSQYIREARSDPDWSDKTRREQLVRDAITRAKNEAASQVFTFDPQDRIERDERRKRQRAS